MSGYIEFRFWSAFLGCDAIRISMCREDGREFFAIVPEESGKVWRKRRTEILDKLMDAMEAGRDPGEVEVTQ